MINDPRELRRHLTVIHMALCLGCAGFLAVTAYLWGSGTLPLTEAIPEVLGIIGLVLAFLLPILAVVLFRRKVRSLPLGAAYADLSQAIRSACILHWALIEGALFFNVVVFMLSAGQVYWVIATALLVLLVLRAPSERRIQRWSTGTP